ncbi:ATPase family protein, partial [Cooperia oncophora]
KKNSLLDGIPVRVKLDQLTDEELRRLVSKSSPRIAHLSKTLVSIFRSLENVPPTSNSRQLTPADLLRGCARVNMLSDLSSNMAIFAELLDSWCLADLPDRAMKLCEKVAAALSITGDQISFHLFLRQPTFSHDDRWCTVGRCRLPSSPSLRGAQAHRLGHTRDVLQLMERLAVCVHNREPVLLVGETGVGKTSIVQCLASAVNATLKVVNLTPSSDTDELISGYKPTTISQVLSPFTHFYHEVFSNTFDVTKNQKFLSHLEDPRWASVIVRGRRIRESLQNGAALFAISRGAVLEAAQEGYWLLIDEINLAPPESLDAIVHAILGNVHPNFRLFACMNPATDAGKRRLPASVRTRFTEFYVPEMTDAHQIALVVSAYLPSMKSAAVSNLVNFYLQAKQLYPMSYSLRTLCRALMFASENMFGNEDRSLYEAICMAFLTNLDAEAKEKMRVRIRQTFRVATNVPVGPPYGNTENYVSVEGYWIERGTELPREDPNYVVTKTVKQNLAEIARITSSGRFPILLEGETSSGKTSIVCHLARISGNAIVRINNHEHTDVQEYMGSYVGDSSGRLVFREGALVKAVRNGSWVILDELNLAPTDIIEALNRVSLILLCPPRTHLSIFTEFYVPEMTDAHQIALVVSAYLPSMKSAAVSNLVNFYLQAKQLYPMSYSLRTLCRALMFASENMFGNEDRSLYEAICMAFLTNLDAEAKEKMRVRIRQTFRVATNVPVGPPYGNTENYVSVEGYWIERGTELPREDPNYVVTKTVKQNLAEIARITSSGRFPILLEGETSSGKTSIVCHLARISGNAIVRINNHEHTDVQDMCALLCAKLAVCAPLLDDNRELYVPETNAVIKAHPRFRLFATQNPAGSYGGRKRLSRALMSRFVVLRFNNIPLDELSSMVCVRCGVHSSAATKMINVLSKLRVKRSITGVFSAKDGLMTLRDVFRWAKRLATDSSCDDWLQVLANHGYFLLAGRCRNQKDATSVVETLEAELKRKIDPSKLFAVNSPYMPKHADTKGIVMTLGMRRMLVMTEQAWLRNEAVLMVGETGGGKTSLAQAVGKGALLTINCHERTETADLLGRLRPRDNGGFAWADGVVISAMKAGVPLLIDEISLAEDSVLERLNPLFEEVSSVMLHRNKSSVFVKKYSIRRIFCLRRPICRFAWADGVVISAMKAGVPLLIDEISLAEDSVLERLNPLFEEDRTLLLSDAGVEVHPVSACDGFQIIATMNPGGDYGKKELSKALRNRFTEVWSSCDYEGNELLEIFNSRLADNVRKLPVSFGVSPAELVINWIAEFFKKYMHMFRHSPSVRDVVACAEIYSACVANGLPQYAAIYEAISAVFLDALNGQQMRVAVDVNGIRSNAELLVF